MPAVFNGVTALIASVISAISAALLSLSAKRVVAVNSFACVLVYLCCFHQTKNLFDARSSLRSSHLEELEVLPFPRYPLP